jgi:hypothetical protein
MSIDCHEDIPGAAELRAWYGGMPSFHDANVLDFRIDGNGKGFLKVQAFRMTDQVDDKGYFILDKHVVVTFIFDGIASIELMDFMQGAILDVVDIQKNSDGFDMAIESSYGFHGSLRVGRITISHDPGTAVP